MRWALLLMLAALPIQWVQVPAGPLGPQKLSVAAVLVVSLLALLRVHVRTLLEVVALAWPFVAGMAALVLAWVGADILNATSPMDAVNQGVQLACFVCVGATLLSVLGTRRGTRLLRWAAPLTLVVLLSSLSGSLVSNGINPAVVVGESIARGDPEYLQSQLFRFGLVGFGFDTDTLVSQVRHEIFAGLMVSAYVSAVAVRLRPFRSRLPAGLVAVAIGLSALLVVASLSRSDTLAVLIWPALAAYVAWQRQRLTGRQLLLVVGGALAVLVATYVGFWSVVVARFTTDTTSYEGRSDLLGQTFERLAENPFTGGWDTAGESSHNFVLDSWLRVGLVGAVIALAVAAVVIGLFLGLAGRLGREPDWMVPVAACLGLVLTRMFTAGGGALPPVEWVAIALVAGFMAHRARLRAAGLLPAPGEEAPTGAAPTGAAPRPAETRTTRTPDTVGAGSAR